MKIRKEINQCWMFLLTIFMVIIGTNCPTAAAVSDIVTNVDMAQNQFSPRAINVIAGSTVRWGNSDSFIPHTVTADSTNSNPDGPNSDIPSPNGILSGQSYSWTVPASAAPGTTWYYHCRFHGQAGNGQAVGSGMTGSITVVGAGLPDIKANGQDGPINVSPASPLSITLSLSEVNQSEILADWWIVASTPAGIYSWVYPNGWTSGLIATGQFQLFNLPTFEFFNGSLPVGEYVFYFGVDTNPDGIANSPLIYDFVQINVNN